MAENENTNPNKRKRRDSSSVVDVVAKGAGDVGRGGGGSGGGVGKGRLEGGLEEGGGNEATAWMGSGAWSNAPRGRSLVRVQMGDQRQGQQPQLSQAGQQVQGQDQGQHAQSTSPLVRESQRVEEARLEDYLEEVRREREREEMQHGQQQAARGDARRAQSGQHGQQGQRAHASQQQAAGNVSMGLQHGQQVQQLNSTQNQAGVNASGLQYGQQQIQNFQRYQQAQRAQLQQQLGHGAGSIPQHHGHNGRSWNSQPQNLLSKTHAQRPQLQAEYLFHESQQQPRSRPSSASLQQRSGPSSMSKLTPQQQQQLRPNNEVSSFQRMGMSPSEQAQLHRQYQQAQQSLRGGPSSGSRGTLQQRSQQAQQQLRQVASPLSQPGRQQEQTLADPSLVSQAAQAVSRQAQLQSRSNAAAVSQLPSQQYQPEIDTQPAEQQLQQAQLQSRSNAASIPQSPGQQTRPGSASNLQSTAKQQQNNEQRLQQSQQQPKAIASPVPQAQGETNRSQITNAFVQAQRNSFSQPGQPLQQQRQAQGLRAQITNGQHPASFYITPQAQRPGQPTQSVSFSGVLHPNQTQPQQAQRANKHYISGSSPSPARQQQQVHQFDPRFSQPGNFSNGPSPQRSGPNLNSTGFFGGRHLQQGGFQQHQEEPPPSFFFPQEPFASYRNPHRLPLTQEEYRQTRLAMETAQDVLYAAKMRKRQLTQMLQDQEKASMCKEKDVETYLEQEKKNKKRKKDEYHMLEDIYELTSKFNAGGYEYGIDAGLGDEFGMGSDGEMSAPDERDDHQGARSAPYMHFGINTEVAGIRVPREEEVVDGVQWNVPVNVPLESVVGTGGRGRGGRKSGTPGRGPGRPRVRHAR